MKILCSCNRFKVLIAIKIVAFFIALGKAIILYCWFKRFSWFTLVGLEAVAASIEDTATFKVLNKEIDDIIKESIRSSR
jgi:hypothetical protein